MGGLIHVPSTQALAPSGMSMALPQSAGRAQLAGFSQEEEGRARLCVLDPPVRCCRVPLLKMSFLSGVLVGTTILSTTDQPSRVWTRASASATCHSALGDGPE